MFRQIFAASAASFLGGVALDVEGDLDALRLRVAEAEADLSLLGTPPRGVSTENNSGTTGGFLFGLRAGVN